MLNAGTRLRHCARLVMSPVMAVAIVTAGIGLVSVAAALPASAAGSTPSTTSINASTLSPGVGAGITIYATITPTAATGTVDFTIGGTAISGCSAETVTTSVALCKTTFAAAGTDDVTATYSGNTTYAVSSDEMAITVVAAAGTFACEPGFSLVDSSSKLWNYDATANAFTETGPTDLGATAEALNGLSFYENTGTPADANNGYMFGFKGSTMYRISNTGALTAWETFSSGFSNPTGATYWNGHGILVEPDQSNTEELQLITVGATASTSTAATVVDASAKLGYDIVVVGTTLWSLNTSGDLTKNTITASGSTFTLGTVTNVTTSGVPTESQGWGSAFSDSNGNIYFFGDNSLKLIEFTAAELGDATPAATTLATAPSGSVATGATDGASCSSASFTYNATYNGNGGTPTSTVTSEKYGSDAIPQAPTVTRTGYTFVGWNTNSGASTGLSFYTVTGNVTLYAIWAIDTYAVTYNGNGGTPTSTVTTENYDSNAITQAPTVTRTGYTFDGWSLTSNGSVVGSYTVTAAVTLYAIWTINTYAVTYNGNGGTPTSTVTNENYNSNAITQAPTVTRTGYTFTGWSLTSNGSTVGSYTVTSAVTLYAIWSINTYAVTYNGNGGTPTSTVTNENYNSNAITQAPTVTQTGYTFDGWSLTSNGSVVGSYTVTAAVTLYAIWTINTYNVTYNGNGGTPSSTVTSENYGSNAITQAPTVTRTGYTFVGWSLTSNGSTVSSETVTGTLTLYAIWTINSYNVTYNGNGGTPTSTVTSEAYNSDAITQAPTVTQTGYTFVGWSLTSNGSTVGSELVPANNTLTLYAIWTINSYNVTYNGNGGTPTSTVTSEVYNSNAITQAPTVTRTGYSFTGWSLTSNGSTVGSESVPANNTLTLYAIWSINSYNVTYDGNGGTPSSTVTSEVYNTDAVSQAPTVTQTGYTFDGWSLTPTGSTVGSEPVPANNTLELYAIWTINSYNVTYDGNGGTPTSTVTSEVYDTDAVAQAPTVTQTGYSFVGWSLTDNGPTVGSELVPANNSLELFAIWTINSYNVTYNQNDGNSDIVQSEVYNTDAVAQAPTVTQTGYTFEGWSLSSDGDTVGSALVPASDTLTLYAIWTINSYNVTYNQNDGNSDIVQSEVYNTDAVAQAPTVTQTGYTFEGWSLSSDGDTVGSALVPADNTLTLYAIWSINSYNVTYDGNGGTPDSTVTSEVYNTDAVAQAPTVTQTGYTFDGWSLTDNGSTVGSELVPADNTLTLYAIWSINSYNVTYDGNGGTPDSTVTSEVYNTDAVSQAPTETQTGYTFVGWSLSSDGDTVGSALVPASDTLTLYAIWSINSYNVTYDGNGGTPDSTVTSEVYNTDAVSQAPTVTQTGYTFVGWSLSSDGDTVGSALVPADDTLTLYAIWSINSYNVTYDGNGGTPDSTVTSEVYNTDAVAQAPTVTQTGYTFTGWSLTSNGSTVGSEPVPAGNTLTLFAIWTINDYNVTYNGNGGTPSSTITSEAYNSDAVAQAPTVTRTGYTFTGWSLTSNGSTVDTEPVPAASTLTLFAIWTINDYNVTYNGNGGAPGSTITSEVYNSDAVAQAPTVTRTGYTFSGWSLTSNGVTVDSEPVPAGNTLTLFAIWTINSYTVTYNGNGGTPSSRTQSENYGTNAVAASSSSPTRTGYSFLGWNTSSSAIAGESTVDVTGDLTLYAVWHYNIVHFNLKVEQTGKGEVTNNHGAVWTKGSGGTKTEVEVKNSKVIFVAHPPAGTVAVYGGACPNHAGTNCTVTMTGNLTVTVFFAPTLPVFYFATNKWNVVLTAAQKATVISILKTLEAHGIKTLWLTGYADIRGSHAANVILGRNRATSVKQYLANLLKTLHLKPMSFFQQVVGASKQWGTLGNNRRVEVSYSPFVKS